MQRAYPETGTRHPPIKAFMDDMTVSANYAPGVRWTLSALEDIIKWARIKLNAKKSRSLVIKRGKIDNGNRFRISGEVIPSISESPIKYLGKVYDDTLKDIANTRNTKAQLDQWVAKIETSNLPGKFKVWCVEYGIIPRTACQLTVYEVSTSAVEAMERRISSRLRRWLGLPQSFTKIGLYGKSTKLKLPLTSLTEEYKVCKIRTQETIDSSSDELVRRSGIRLEAGRKWHAGKMTENPN